MDTDIELNCKGVLGTREHDIQHPVTSHRVPWYEEQVVNITLNPKKEGNWDGTERDGTGRSQNHITDSAEIIFLSED